MKGCCLKESGMPVVFWLRQKMPQWYAGQDESQILDEFQRFG